jgi:hypothetical protein
VNSAPVPPTVRDFFGRVFAKRRFGQRIDEIIDLATRDPAEAKARALRLIEWLISRQSSEPEIEAAIEDLRALVDAIDE